ncbi:mitochondrial sodium/hydrogen exchanger 9B2-like isoform X1 [Dinothrombium tinctorium]|uniref:Mitochondrial sodium/hydrogen exchanger 9B2-like isoform X1 n=1 Tax=Dinothrombium tinctorium TaxID=1965070 RepID=A0A443Q9W2_9ACAR|nr:mitochondrial sodium/hydrogen exchanger 9B2-like isoform X1 [Dinothrombium tinctorium]
MKSEIVNFFTEILMIVLFWACIWTIFGEKANPGGPIFDIFALYISATILGKVISLNKCVPPLVGMLFAGFMLRNVYPSTFDTSLFHTVGRFACAIIMIRAGLRLNAKLLRKNIKQCMLLALLPSILEASVIAICSHFFGVLPLEWGYLLGFATASVSPAVIVPSLLVLKENGIALNKGIDTILIASSTIENIFVIAMFGIVFSVIFSTSHHATLLQVIVGPVEIFVGLIYGVLCGLILWFVPYEKSENAVKRRYSVKCFIIIVLSSTFASFGSDRIGCRIAASNIAKENKEFAMFFVFAFVSHCYSAFLGSLACVVEAFVAAIKWRKYYSIKFVERYLKVLWKKFCEPLLFSIIGAQIKLSYLKQRDLNLLVLCVILALICRTVTIFIVSSSAKFDFKERLFVAIAGIPKATVQASLGPIALEFARNANSHEFERYSTLVLATAFLSIFLTASIGAFAIYFSAPKLLNSSKSEFYYEKVENDVSVISCLLEENNECKEYHTFI